MSNLGKLPKNSTCDSFQTVHSKALGKNVKRCADFTTPAEKRGGKKKPVTHGANWYAQHGGGGRKSSRKGGVTRKAARAGGRREGKK